MGVVNRFKFWDIYLTSARVV